MLRISRIVVGVISGATALLSISNTACATSNSVGAPTFKWSSSEPIIGRDFEKFKKTQLAKLPPKSPHNAALEITGLYSAAEQQAAGNPVPNLGLARAAKTAAFFAPSIQSNRIKLASALVTDDGFTEVTKKMAPFAAISFADVPMKKLAPNAAPSIKPMPILFPINKVIRHPNPAVSAYLAKVAASLKSSGRRTMLIGYADRRGATEINIRLATQRAESIRAELIKLGVSANQIDISTQSAADKTSTDDSINARQLRRRVEILVL
jgi:outer membrane protein OmpA-like peptidoglycan-associated protein